MHSLFDEKQPCSVVNFHFCSLSENANNDWKRILRSIFKYFRIFGSCFSQLLEILIQTDLKNWSQSLTKNCYGDVFFPEEIKTDKRHLFERFLRCIILFKRFVTENCQEI